MFSINDHHGFGESLSKKRWLLKDYDHKALLHLSQSLQISEILAKILLGRDVCNDEDAEGYLNPRLSSLMPSPFLLKDMDRAAERIANAIIGDESVAVFGDYDVDGITSISLIKLFFRELGSDIEYYIPNRLTEGYGPNNEAFTKLHESGNTLVITVDCGTSSFEPLAHGTKLGLDIIVLDHHLSTGVLPNAYAVVNPNRHDESFEYKSMAAVGVVFMTMVAVRNKLREKRWFNFYKEPDLLKYLDLVALGTICDVMSLRGLNRAFVKHGIKLMSEGSNIGIRVLANVSGITGPIQASHVGYVLGPRINAGGRIGDAVLGIKLLCSKREEEAWQVAVQLNDINQERKRLESSAMGEIVSIIEKKGLQQKNAIIIASKTLHNGILGILASRLKEQYSVPVCVISIDDAGYAKGSMRSINGVNAGEVLSAGKNAGILIVGGGHANAGGFSLHEDKIDEFYDFLLDYIGKIDTNISEANQLLIDAILSPSSLTHHLLQDINTAAPYGNNNPVPVFALLNVRIVRLTVIGKSHLLLKVSDAVSPERRLQSAIWFRIVESAIGQYLIKEGRDKVVNMVGIAQENQWDRARVDFIIQDVSLIQDESQTKIKDAELH